jgi:hypothetical protein
MNQNPINLPPRRLPSLAYSSGGAILLYIIKEILTMPNMYRESSKIDLVYCDQNTERYRELHMAEFMNSITEHCYWYGGAMISVTSFHM